ncbi:hypothetical protein BDW22DRAFT_1484736 [Trametopsis cervina]|nr:hypothetical protein BDW22DRAFT_1484736 [Trametopsis cervina]
MPGPCSSKKKKKLQAKKEKRAKLKETPPAAPHVDIDADPSLTDAQSVHPPSLPQSVHASSTPSPDLIPLHLKDHPHPTHPTHPTHPSRPASASPDAGYASSLLKLQQYLDSIQGSPDDVPHLLRSPCVEDLGDGPRVRDVRAFLESKIAAPVSVDDPLCVEFAQREVLEMLCCVLPEETAMIAWYNLSRAKSRVCPACKRLYHLGDHAYEPFVYSSDEDEDEDDEDAVQRTQNDRGRRTEGSRRLHDEQVISGICSALCYLLVAHAYPGAMRSAFGRRAEDISDEAWAELDRPLVSVGIGEEAGKDAMGLGMLLKMSRCHDMGLGQLMFPEGASGASEGAGEGEGEWDSGEWEWESGEEEEKEEGEEREGDE